MDNSLFFKHVEENDHNREIIEVIEDFAFHNTDQQIYLITAPLGAKYSYNYEKNALVILSPKHKIIFIDLNNDPSNFENYYNDFIEDLNSISDKFGYKDFIGRPREWKLEVTTKEVLTHHFQLSDVLDKNLLNKDLQRKSELLISLLIGSINDIEKIGIHTPETLLDKVRKNIILFDGDQTRFIYKNFNHKVVSIQGLSGTGKTELLLHKLKELYLADTDDKIFFTCHNIALANTLRERIPTFFNFMKVEKQIEWNQSLWVDRAWGSRQDKNSGLYSYLCHFYKVPFLRFSATTDYTTIFSQVLDQVNKLEQRDFNYAFDYILIDERQDFPNVFFELCKKITRKKVFVAGDIFQDIFENTQKTELDVDVVLNRCYRTDPRTLMFAHAIGIGLFEEKKLNWFDDEYWKAIGYDITRHANREVHFSREPIRRFEDLELENFESVIIEKTTKVQSVINILKGINDSHSSLNPSDIAIIILDDGEIYGYIDTLCYQISEQMSWKVNRAYESKSKENDAVYITNPNNVKGLEFPFVICITGSFKNTYRHRNILYTMLTRSFIQSYLLVQNDKGLKVLKEGLDIINKERYIKATEPTLKEKEDIRNTIIKVTKEKNISYKEFLNALFDELKIAKRHRNKFEKALIQAEVQEFNREKTMRFIEANREFYCNEKN